MFIKSIIVGIDRLVHGGKHYPVVNGIADVPQEVRDEIVSHVDWQDATEEIDQETLSALEEANKQEEKQEELGAPDDSELKQPEEPEVPPESEQPKQEVVLEKKENKKKKPPKSEAAVEGQQDTELKPE